MRSMIAAVMVVVTAGCVTTASQRVPARAPSDAELRVLGEAIRPLLEELDYPRPRRPEDCRVGLAILVSPTINAGVGRGSTKPCYVFTLGVTEGAVRRLSVGMLRAILAHELGHVQLHHLDAKKQWAGAPAVFHPLTRVFDRGQEEEADRFAVELLRKIDARAPGSCLALVHLFALLAEQPRRTAAWLSTHPSPERRSETALEGCQRRVSSSF
jgi:predicted Zn-dependent protease